MDDSTDDDAVRPNGLSAGAIRRAIHHLRRQGDSDIVPPLPEYLFFNENQVELVKICSNLTLGSFNPKSAVQLLSPKSEFGYRIAHQLTAFDNLIYLSAAVVCARPLETQRALDESGRAFSYRFLDGDEPLLFRRDRSFHEWLEFNHQKVGLRGRITGRKWVALTDISDFYHRIYQHRIDNCLDEYTGSVKARLFVVKLLKKIRAEQSFGLPVGSSGSRVVAEAVMIDTDNFIASEGWDSTRFVDDIRMFFKEKTDAQTALGKLAHHLMITEGLSLNSSKTRIMPVQEYATYIRELMEDVFSEDEVSELDHLFRIEYGQEDESDEERDPNITPEAILEKLRGVVADGLDISRLRAVLRALRVYPLEDISAFIEEFGELFLIVPRDMSLAISTALEEYSFLQTDREKIQTRNNLINLLTTQPYQELPILRIWVLELFARGYITPTREVIAASVRSDSSILERRQILLMRARIGDKAYFRTLKTQFSELSDWEKPIAMWAACCLPSDEYGKWVTFAKSLLNEPYSEIYAPWLVANQNRLLLKLSQEHGEIDGPEEA